MKIWLKIENICLLLLILLVYFKIYQFSWLILIIFLFVPDLSMIGYLINPKYGALIYNLIHNLSLSALLFAIGLLSNQQIFIMIGLILFAHIFLDRALGYGLKYPDSFKHTHLNA
ncbi:MAG: DUF4260 domain-containing protein [Streptococcaceae bacterium]|nr:DUF4260 domain-containing protein [Streptococcaceae bacterium]MCH4176762.1 DUF4260 domain-containing protein [Streptococcaceae bacterium]